MQDYLTQKAQLIESHLDSLVPLPNNEANSLFEAARYSLLGGGKRLRPILALAAAEMLEGNPAHILTPACALEMVHTYSLIHDDLPCMDDDDFRRGKWTVHKKYSEGHAVLTGDFLLTYAFEILATAPCLSAEKKVTLMTLLAKSSGGGGMIGGQVLDVACEGKNISLETLQRLHRNKTGALITAAVQFGGIVADATHDQMKALQQYGENIGLAFQIVDDILDVTASQEKHGRTTSSDIINGKSTYVTLLGLEEAQASAERCYDQALAAVSLFQGRTYLLESLADYIVNRARAR